MINQIIIMKMHCLLFLFMNKKNDIKSFSNEYHEIYPESIYKLKGDKNNNWKRYFRDKVNYENKFKAETIDTYKNKKNV